MRPQRSWTTSYVCAGSSICIRSDRGERRVCQAENAGSKDPAYTSVTQNAGSKDPAYTSVTQNAGSKDPAYTSVTQNAGSEDPAYTSVT
jgi:hypothetical protein